MLAEGVLLLALDAQDAMEHAMEPVGITMDLVLEDAKDVVSFALQGVEERLVRTLGALARVIALAALIVLEVALQHAILHVQLIHVPLDVRELLVVVDATLDVLLIVKPLHAHLLHAPLDAH